MIVLDTTVLVYATGSDHPLREPCRELLAEVIAGRRRATTTVEVIQEFVHVRARRHGRTEAAALGHDYADLLAPLLPVTADHLRTGLHHYARVERLGAFDAVLAASAIEAGADALVSTDAAFADVPSLRHVDPADEPAMRQLLG